jgi:hypothetical protein
MSTEWQLSEAKPVNGELWLMGEETWKRWELNKNMGKDELGGGAVLAGGGADRGAAGSDWPGL